MRRDRELAFRCAAPNGVTAEKMQHATAPAARDRDPLLAVSLTSTQEEHTAPQSLRIFAASPPMLTPSSVTSSRASSSCTRVCVCVCKLCSPRAESRRFSKLRCVRKPLGRHAAVYVLQQQPEAAAEAAHFQIYNGTRTCSLGVMPLWKMCNSRQMQPRPSGGGGASAPPRTWKHCGWHVWETECCQSSI